MYVSWQMRLLRSSQLTIRFISELHRGAVWAPLCNLLVDSLYIAIYNREHKKKIERLDRGCVFYQYFLYQMAGIVNVKGKGKDAESGSRLRADRLGMRLRAA